MNKSDVDALKYQLLETKSEISTQEKRITALEGKVSTEIPSQEKRIAALEWIAKLIHATAAIVGGIIVFVCKTLIEHLIFSIK